MMGTTHMAFSGALFLSLKLLGLPATVDLAFFALLLGSVFPDIDHPQGLLASNSGLFHWVSKGVSHTFGHRGPVHSLLASVLVGLAVLATCEYLALGSWVAFAFWFGYATHLLGDSLTPSGIAWLYPLSAGRLRGPLRTGSGPEKLLFFTLILVAGYMWLFV